jgi:hypothetical protein
MIALAHVRTLSVGGPILMVSWIAGVWNDEVVRMTKKFARRARLIREILRIGTAALRFVKVVLEILDKAANCDARKLSVPVQTTR